MAARVKVHQTVTTKSRRRKTSNNGNYIQCNMCHGTGRVKNNNKKKK